MYLMDLIEKYVSMSVVKDNLQETITTETLHEQYAKVKGDISFNNSNYKNEKRFNDSARTHKQTKETAKLELTQVSQYLQNVYEAYLEFTNSMDYFQLKEIASIVLIKIEELKRNLDDLIERRKWAIQKGNEAYAARKLSEEQLYNKTAAECADKIEHIKKLLKYYNEVSNDLDIKLANKNSRR